MKKAVSLLSAAAVTSGILLGIMNYDVAVADSIKVVIEDEQLFCNVEPYIENERTYVPMRSIFEALGASVSWDPETKTITSSKQDGTQVVMTVGSVIMKVGDDTYTCDAAPVIKNDTTMVPVRYIADAFDMVTDWDETTKTVTISERHIDEETENSGDTAWKSNIGTVDLDTMTVTGDGIAVEDKKIKITKGGIFTITGTMDDGRITINTEEKEKVKLILDNASITCSDGPAIYFKDCLKAFLELAPGSENYLEDGYTYENSDLKATLFAKDDLDIQGTGSLTIKSNSEDGIHVKDTFEIHSGDITIDAAQDGIHVNDGIDFSGGSLAITAYQDGIQSEYYLNVYDGMKLDITTTCDDKKSETSENSDFGMMRGNNIESVLQGLGYDTQSEDFLNTTVQDIMDELSGLSESEDNSVSAMGLKSDGDMLIDGGEITINSTDHCIKSEKDITINSGTLTLNSEYAKGIKCIFNLTVNNGTINVLKSTEGLEAKQLFTINDGSIDVVASDDGFNLGGGTGFGRKDDFDSIDYTDMLLRYAQNLDITTATMKELLENTQNGINMGNRNNRQPPQTDGSDNIQTNNIPNRDTTGQPPAIPDDQNRDPSVSAPENSDLNNQDINTAQPPQRPDDTFGGRQMGGAGGFQGGTSSGDTSRVMMINGGNIHIIAENDCLDSNGYLTINGGNITLECRSIGGGETALDPDNDLTITGGTLQTVINGSTSLRLSASTSQNIVTINMDQTIPSETGYTITDPNGNTVVSFTPSIDYRSVTVSSEYLKSGQDYTFTAGDYTTAFTLTDTNTTVGTSFTGRF